MQNRPDLLQALMDRLPLGLILMQQNQVILANPIALQYLGVSTAGQIQRIDGPDGPLIERFDEARNGGTFDYRVPETDDRLERLLRIQVAPFETDQRIVRLDDVTAQRKQDAEREAAIRHAFHELKTPFAVLSMGISHLDTYYSRLSDDERREMIKDIADQAREMTTILDSLFRDLSHRVG